ncbi:MAG: hypothetical protein R3C09_21980 [Pirellulaceae bacterium]
MTTLNYPTRNRCHWKGREQGGSGSLSYVYDAASRLASLNDTTTIGTGFLRQFSVSPLAPLAASALICPLVALLVVLVLRERTSIMREKGFPWPVPHPLLQSRRWSSIL